MTRTRSPLPSSDAFLNHRRSLAGARRKQAVARACATLVAASRSPEPEPAFTWLDLTEDSTPEEIDQAYENTFGGAAPDTQAGAASTTSILACPLDPAWRGWDIIGNEARQYFSLTPEEQAACVTSRRVTPIHHLGAFDIVWAPAADDAGGEDAAGAVTSAAQPERTPGERRHAHGETRVGKALVHIDRITATFGGPGRSYCEFRLFVNGTLAGRGGQGGVSLGGGGSDLPAVAIVGDGLAITVDGASGGDAPIVELWKVKPRRR